MKTKITSLLFFFCILFSVNAQTVNIEGNPYNGNPYATITDAITASNNGDVILITGVHTEPITISKSITLRGTDPTTDIIQAATTASNNGTGSRVIGLVRANDTDVLNITIENLGVRYGNADGSSNGGGIDADKIKGTLTLNNLIIENNHSGRNGGGLSFSGTNVEMTNCTVQNNSSSLDGGGLLIAPHNGVQVDNVVNIKQTLINSNNARNGGGIFLNGNNGFGNDYKIDVNIENSTISNNTTNSASSGNGGGAIYTASATLTGSNPAISNVTLQLVHVTVYNNSHASANKAGLQFAGTNTANFSAYNSIIVAADDVAVKALNFANTNTTAVVNCILGGLNAAPAVVDDANNNNQKGKTATFAGITGTLTTEGGKTQVLAITDGSTSDDFCTASVSISLPSIDQRGATREGTPDAGAFEFGGTLSTKSNEFANISIYPNPAKNIVFIKGVNDLQSLELYNILGKQVKQVKNSDSMNLESLSTGVYLLMVTNSSSSIAKKIIIE